MMDDDAAFVTRLIGFGLSEKEAKTYLHLLKYGPKTPSPLAKSMKTYREDVHRALTVDRKGYGTSVARCADALYSCGSQYRA